MVAERLRSVMLRPLPALLLVLFAVAAAPQQRPTAVPPAVVAYAAADAAPEPADAVAEPAVDAASAPADRTTALTSQFTAGVRGSRAPPAAAV